MKRVKIMLSAVLVMAVVAGALAFKAKKSVRFCVYTHTASTSCPFLTTDFSITTPTVNGDPTTIYVTTLDPQVAPCPTTTVCTNTLKITAEQ